MEAREKLKFYFICGGFAAIALSAVVVAVLGTGAAAREQARSKERAEELIYESAADADRILSNRTGASEDVRYARILRAAMGGKLGCAYLEEGDVKEGLLHFFETLDVHAEGEAPEELRVYAAELAETMRSNKIAGRQVFRDIPLYDAPRIQAAQTADSMDALNEKQARALAEQALGGNIKLEPGDYEGREGYVYRLKNAFVRVGVSGRITELRRDTAYTDEDAVTLSMEEAKKRAMSCLISAGYDPRAIEMIAGELRGKIWYMLLRYGEMGMTVAISGVSGAWCELTLRGSTK